jgi:hypothetical protein
MKPRRTAPRKAARPEPVRQNRSNRARRREALEQQGRAAARPIYPDPEADGADRP